MRKTLSMFLVLIMALTMTGAAFAQEMTEVGTPRNETLVVEFQTPTKSPGQFNPYMRGTSMGTGIHQLMMAQMWEMDTIKGEQFGEVAEGIGFGALTHHQFPGNPGASPTTVIPAKAGMTVS